MVSICSLSGDPWEHEQEIGGEGLTLGAWEHRTGARAQSELNPPKKDAEWGGLTSDMGGGLDRRGAISARIHNSKHEG